MAGVLGINSEIAKPAYDKQVAKFLLDYFVKFFGALVVKKA